MITDTDIKKLKKTFVTKEDLRLNTEYIVQAMTEMTDNVIERIDKVLDRTITNEDELQDHENRLRKVENKILVI